MFLMEFPPQSPLSSGMNGTGMFPVMDIHPVKRARGADYGH